MPRPGYRPPQRKDFLLSPVGRPTSAILLAGPRAMGWRTGRKPSGPPLVRWHQNPGQTRLPQAPNAPARSGDPPRPPSREALAPPAHRRHAASPALANKVARPQYLMEGRLADRRFPRLKLHLYRVSGEDSRQYVPPDREDCFPFPFAKRRQSSLLRLHPAAAGPDVPARQRLFPRCKTSRSPRNLRQGFYEFEPACPERNCPPLAARAQPWCAPHFHPKPYGDFRPPPIQW